MAAARAHINEAWHCAVLPSSCAWLTVASAAAAAMRSMLAGLDVPARLALALHTVVAGARREKSRRFLRAGEEARRTNAVVGWGNASVVVAGQSIDSSARGNQGQDSAGDRDQATEGTARFLLTTTTTPVAFDCYTAAARPPARSRAGREELEPDLRAPPRRGVGHPENGPAVAWPAAGVASGWAYATVLLPRYAN